MVRENRIKTRKVSAFSVVGSTITQYDNYPQPINGEILKVRIEGISSPGSLWIAESGTDILIYKRNSIISGLALYEDYPIIYGKEITGYSSGSPQAFFSPVCNEVIKLCGSGFTSGTGTIFGPITIYYR